MIYVIEVEGTPWYFDDLATAEQCAGLARGYGLEATDPEADHITDRDEFDAWAATWHARDKEARLNISNSYAQNEAK